MASNYLLHGKIGLLDVVNPQHDGLDFIHDFLVNVDVLVGIPLQDLVLFGMEKHPGSLEDCVYSN